MCERSFLGIILQPYYFIFFGEKKNGGLLRTGPAAISCIGPASYYGPF
jgi:hypothetical protein